MDADDTEYVDEHRLIYYLRSSVYLDVVSLVVNDEIIYSVPALRSIYMDYYTDDRVIEFKYFKSGEAKKILAFDAPRTEDTEQVKGYAYTIRKQFPNFTVRTYVAYIATNQVYRFWGGTVVNL